MSLAALLFGLRPRTAWSWALALGALSALQGCGRNDFAYLTTESGGSSDSGSSTGDSSDTSIDPSTTDESTTTSSTETDSTDTIDPSTTTTGPIPIECGNEILEEGEQCDPGIEEIGPEQPCLPGCVLNLCGDGIEGGTNEECDDGNNDQTDACSNACTLSVCGDGIVWAGQEQCDDGDGDDDDACHLDCTRTQITDVALGGNHTCARLDNGAVRCWGNGNNGRTGQGSLDNLGDDELPGLAPTLSLGNPVAEIATALSHTCVRYDGGQVRCFGRAAEGQLGYGNVEDVGDDELPSDAGLVPVPGPVAALAMRAGAFHSCVLMTDGDVRCWGLAADGRLGVPGLTGSLGDDESIGSTPPVQLGGAAVQITSGALHSCALLASGEVICWGSSNSGQLGYGNNSSVGDDEHPVDVGPVQVGGEVISLSAGFYHTCALLVGGQVRCWGRGNNGRLGYGNTAWVGFNDTPADVGTVDVGGTVIQLEAGNAHTCALLQSGAVRCWGWAEQGQLGYGNLEDIGDDEAPAAAGDVPLGGVAIDLAADANHTCALMDTGQVRCWGNGGDGRLGYGDVDTIGDDELPADVGDVPLLL